MNVAALSKAAMGALGSNIEMKTGLIKLGTSKLSPEERDKFLAVKAKFHTEQANAELKGVREPTPKCVETIDPASQMGDLVICQLCGIEYRRITHFHTECKHRVTLEQYRMLFPWALIEGQTWRDGQRAKRLAQGDAWNRGLTKEDARVAKYADKMKGKEKSPEHCHALSLAKKGKLARDPEYGNRLVSNITIIARNVRPTKPEMKMGALLDKYFPDQWKFVGNGGLVLRRLVPDFMAINGKKQLIEVYGDYWHRHHNPQDRIDRLKEFGYSAIVIWEKELKKDEAKVLEKIRQFLRDDDMAQASAKAENNLHRDNDRYCGWS